MRNNLILFGKIAVAGLLFFLLFKYNLIQISLLKNLLTHIDLTSCAIVCLFLGIVIQGIRWKLLLQAAEIPLSWKTVLQLYLIGSFFSMYLPGAAGGDAVRGIYIYCLLAAERRPTGILVLLTDRLFSLLGLLSIATGIYIFFPTTVQHEAVLITDGRLASGLLFGIVSFIFFCYCIANFIQKRTIKFLPQWLIGYLQTIFSMILLYRQKWLVISYCCLLSILASGIVVIGIILLAAIFPFSPKPSITAIAGVYGNLSSVIPVTPGGIGIGEAVFAKVCMDLAAVTAPFATIYFVFRLGMMLANIPGLFAYLLFELAVHRQHASTIEPANILLKHDDI